MKKASSTFLLILLSLLMSHSSGIATPTGKAKVKGIIRDTVTNHPIEHANLVLINSSNNSTINGSISDNEGNFAIENIDKGSYHLKVYFIGYETKTLENIEIKSKKEVLDLGIILLHPANVLLETAEIVATNNYIDFKIDKKVINVSEHINAEGSAVVEALHNVPSVQVDASGTVTVRGSSSFTLLIDGRPSVMEASEALNQILASSVEKIEVITNPSVKYDSEGRSGIINLIMKKQKVSGTSGQATVTLATGDKYSASVLVNQRNKKISSHLGGSYSNKRKQTESTDDREVFYGDTSNFENIASDRDIYRRNYKINGGLIYDVNANNAFSFDAEIGQWEFDRNIDSRIHLHNSYQSEQSYLQSNESFLLTNKYFSGALGYSHQFDKEGHKLDGNLFYSSLDNDTPNNIYQNELDEDGESIPGTSEFLKTHSQASRDHMRLKVDYELPISENLQLEAGYQNDSKKSTSDYSYQLRSNLNENWDIDSTLSGMMDFNRQINSLYATLGTHLWEIEMQVGLRMEISDRTLEQKKIQHNYEYDDINFFPSLHLSKALEKDQQISASYSRRISRPNEWMLLPAPNSTGRNMLQIGNPELKPDFTDSWELAYSKRSDLLMLSLELYSSNTKNAITITTTENNGLFYQSYENLDRNFSTGLDVMGNINIATWWRINIAANIYGNKMQGTLKSGYRVDNSSLAWNGRFRTTFIVKRKTYLEFMAVYYGPSVLPQGKSQDFYYFDFFVKRSFFKRKLSIALRSHNTFDTGIYIEDMQGTDFKAHTWFKYEGPTFMITMTYRLNNFSRKNATNNMDMNYDSGLDQ